MQRRAPASWLWTAAHLLTGDEARRIAANIARAARLAAAVRRLDTSRAYEGRYSLVLFR